MITDVTTKSALLVEDNQHWARRTRLLLQEAGYSVREVDNLEEAEAQRKHSLYVASGNFPLQKNKPSNYGAGLTLYNTITRRYGTDVKFILMLDDRVLETDCLRRDIKFFRKDRFDVGSFLSYLLTLT